MEEEFIRLIQNHEGILHKVGGLYTNDEEERKDLHQEMLLQAWKSYRNFRQDAKFSTWLYKVCLNTALTYRKKEESRKQISDEMQENTVQISENAEEEHELLYHIIRKLDEVDRMLITLHLEGYKNPEIAEITGMTVNHVNVKIHRVKGKIIDQFKKVSDGPI